LGKLQVVPHLEERPLALVSCNSATAFIELLTRKGGSLLGIHEGVMDKMSVDIGRHLGDLVLFQQSVRLIQLIERL